VSQFQARQAQLSLFPERNPASTRDLDRIVDAITAKYGQQALVRGAVLDLKDKK
jgi:hypothetical protein